MSSVRANLTIVVAVLIAGLILGSSITYFAMPLKERTITTTKTITLKESPLTITETRTVFATTTVKSEYPITIIDALGRIVVISKEPKRIVSLSPAITEDVFALGLGEYVVGVDSFSNYPPEVVKLRSEGKIANVGGYWQPDLEKIVELNPDLVLADAGVHAKLHEKFVELGLTVVYVKGGLASSLEDIMSDLGLIAQIFHIERKAEEISKKLSSQIKDIEEKLTEANVSKVKVLILLGPPSWGYWSAGSGTFINCIISVAGGVNIASKYHGWVRLSLEDILSENPDVIIVSLMASSEEAKKVIDEIMSSELANVNAVKEGKIYVLIGKANDVLMRPGPRIVEAAKIMAQILHSEVFGGVSRNDVITPKAVGSLSDHNNIAIVKRFGLQCMILSTISD